MRARVFLFASPLLVSIASVAAANDPATAQALFAQAMTAMKNGDYATACPKLEASFKLDPGMATEFRLAECEEKLGKTATAWSTYLEVADEAAKQKLVEREKFARDRAAALAGKLAKLTLNVPSLPGLEVTRDGAPVLKETWGSALPIDPGEHVIEAKAPGKAPFKKTITIVDATSTQIDVTLADAPGDAITTSTAPTSTTTSATPASSPSSPTPDAPPASSTWSTQKTLAVAAAVVGVGGLAAGTLFGLGAKSKLDASNAGHCHDNLCDQTGLDDRASAKSKATLSTVMFGVGIAGVVGAGVLWFTAPSSSTTTVGVGPGSVLVQGSF